MAEKLACTPLTLSYSALLSARDKLGTVRFIECHRLAAFQKRGADVDVVLDLMIHDLDVILSLIEGKPVEEPEPEPEAKSEKEPGKADKKADKKARKAEEAEAAEPEKAEEPPPEEAEPPAEKAEDGDGREQKPKSKAKARRRKAEDAAGEQPTIFVPPRAPDDPGPEPPREDSDRPSDMFKAILAH